VAPVVALPLVVEAAPAVPAAVLDNLRYRIQINFKT
jgi:hypothetical protein